jgi:site-specific DNA recombinase
MSRPLRCAVYTRKSSEEGLEQAFNSLHAQREACEAYIKSQAHEGWKLVKTSYDDGGYSGGSMERPALQRLLAEIVQGQINVVVVYKVDRLTRSLADFARIVEALDRHGASFVSVTQQFNTTTSMGRLTLNVLLSFAQFEREVTGERIRDKVAASRRKGMWMGGTVPLGYDVKQRTLVVNETEAATVRDIFETYIGLGSVASLQRDLERRGVVSKRWTSSTGRARGGFGCSDGGLRSSADKAAAPARSDSETTIWASQRLAAEIPKLTLNAPSLVSQQPPKRPVFAAIPEVCRADDLATGVAGCGASLTRTGLWGNPC